MLITPSKRQKLKEDRIHEGIIQRDREAFRAFQRSHDDYQRLRRFYIACFIALAVVTLACVIVLMN